MALNSGGVVSAPRWRECTPSRSARTDISGMVLGGILPTHPHDRRLCDICSDFASVQKLSVASYSQSNRLHQIKHPSKRLSLFHYSSHLVMILAGLPLSTILSPAVACSERYCPDRLEAFSTRPHQAGVKGVLLVPIIYLSSSRYACSCNLLTRTAIRPT